MFDISSVTIGALSKPAFDLATQFTFNTGLLVSICKDKVTIKKGSPLKLPTEFSVPGVESFDQTILKHMEVLDCEPVNKGLLTVTTKFIVVDISERECKRLERTEKERVSTEPLYLSDFISPIKISDIASSISKVKKGSNSLKSWDFFKVQALSSISCYDYVQNDDVNIDLNYTVFTPKQIAQRHGLFNECLVECVSVNYSNSLQASQSISTNGSIQNDAETKPKSKRRQNPTVARIKIIPDDAANDGCVYMSPVLVFNALKPKEASVCTDVFLRKFSGLPTVDVVSSSSACWFCELPFATELHIDNINSPTYGSGGDFSNLLQKYFTKVRHVKKGDVIAMATKDDADYWQDATDGLEDTKPVIYYKVLKVMPKVDGLSTFRADREHTTLYVNGVCHSYVPSVTSSCLTGAALYPPGLEPVVHKLLQWIKPAMKRSGACALLLSGPAGCGKTSVVRSAAMTLYMHYIQVNCHELCGETSAATEARIKHVLGRASAVSPCVLNLHNIEALGKDRDGSNDPRVASAFRQQLATVYEENKEWPVIVIATSSYPRQLSVDLQECFLHHMEMDVPTDKNRLVMLRHLVGKMELGPDVSLKHVAQRTAGFVLGDLSALISQVKTMAIHDVVDKCGGSSKCRGDQWQTEAALVDAGCAVRGQHFVTALDAQHAAQSDTIGAPKIPSVAWEDVGGLLTVKADILDTIQLPLEHPELFAAGLRRSGVLLYGPPGTGKTLLAKAVATECSLNFLSVKGPELINMYVGQSEENVRQVFEKARSASPCVIFFDELDSLAPNRGRSGDSGGVMDRVVSQLLAELDGLHRSCDVFVIGATNRPDLLDPALLRPGRFDKLLYLGVSMERSSQLHILKALTRKFTLADDCDLERVCEMCPWNMTGADFYALCSDAMLNSMKRKITQLQQGEDVDQSRVEVCYEDFEQSVDQLVPSVSEQELLHYQTVQANFSQQK